MVANDAEALGMQVSGYDPFLSVDSAWGLSRSVKKAVSLDELIADSDFISLHRMRVADTSGCGSIVHQPRPMRQNSRGVRDRMTLQ